MWKVTSGDTGDVYRRLGMQNDADEIFRSGDEVLILGADSLNLYGDAIRGGAGVDLPDFGCKLLGKASQTGALEGVVAHEIKCVHRRGNEDDQSVVVEVLEEEYVAWGQD